jgi:Zn-dependent protease with chaperone function
MRYPQPIARHDPALGALVHPKERLYYGLLLVASLALYALLAAFLLGAVATPETGAVLGVVAMYAAIFGFGFFFLHGLMIGRIRGNGVRVTAAQFPMLHRQVAEHARRLGMRGTPDVFIMQEGGALNAFATRFFGRDFVVVYSDVLALAQARGEAAVGFIVAHELGHVARGHLRLRWLTMPGRMVPYLGAAWSRACEYTCDRFGAHCQPDGAVDGLLVLAAGPALYREVDAREYARQVETETGFWVKRAELMSTHPNLPKRVAALVKAGARVPEYSPMRPEVHAVLHVTH